MVESGDFLQDRELSTDGTDGQSTIRNSRFLTNDVTWSIVRPVFGGLTQNERPACWRRDAFLKERQRVAVTGCVRSERNGLLSGSACWNHRTTIAPILTISSLIGPKNRKKSGSFFAQPLKSPMESGQGCLPSRCAQTRKVRWRSSLSPLAEGGKIYSEKRGRRPRAKCREESHLSPTSWRRGRCTRVQSLRIMPELSLKTGPLSAVCASILT